MTLEQVPIGQRARILRISGSPNFIERIQAFGLLDGDETEILEVAPLGDPIEILISGSRISIRKAEAKNIEVEIIESLPV